MRITYANVHVMEVLNSLATLSSVTAHLLQEKSRSRPNMSFYNFRSASALLLLLVHKTPAYVVHKLPSLHTRIQYMSLSGRSLAGQLAGQLGSVVKRPEAATRGVQGALRTHRTPSDKALESNFQQVHLVVKALQRCDTCAVYAKSVNA